MGITRSPHGGYPNGFYLVPKGESFPHTGGDPKGIPLVPKADSHSPHGRDPQWELPDSPHRGYPNGFYLIQNWRVIPPKEETHNGNLQKGSSNIASPIRERERKAKNASKNKCDQ
jgi:hypothetical protein